MLFAAALDEDVPVDLVGVEDKDEVARLPIVELEPEAEAVGLRPDAVAVKFDDVTKLAHARRVLLAKWMTKDLSPI
jgi:hypothetical protein